MESSTKFDLEKRIHLWKLQLSENQNMTNDNIVELESHIYDEIENLQNLGLSEEESFLIAEKRIGKIESLVIEYSKVNRKAYFINKIAPYLKGILLFLAFISITDLFVSITFLISENIGMKLANLKWMSIGMIIIITISLFAGIYRKYKNGKRNRRILQNVPLLVIFIIASYVLNQLGKNIFIGSGEISNYRSLFMNLHIYRLVFVLIIMIFSGFVYYSLKKGNKMKIIN